MKAYSPLRVAGALLVFAVFGVVVLYGCSSKSGNAKKDFTPVDAGLLYSVSKLNERHIHLTDSIRYAVAYHNAFIKTSAPLVISSMVITDSDGLELDIRQGDISHTFREGLANRSTEEVISVIFKVLVAPVQRVNPVVGNKTVEVDSFLATGDEFSYIKALKRLNNVLYDNSQAVQPELFAKAARIYLNLYLISHRDRVSSFYEDLLSRAMAMNCLASSLAGNSGTENQDISICNRVMLNYFTGNSKRAYELAMSPEGARVPFCGIFSMLKGSLPGRFPDDTPDVEYWRLKLAGGDDKEAMRKILEPFYRKSPDNLFVLSQMSRLGVSEGRQFAPVLVTMTVQKHLALINEEYADWLKTLPGSRDLRVEDGNLSRLKTIITAFGRRYPVLSGIISRIVDEDDSVVPSYSAIKTVNKILFKDKRYATMVNADLFSGEDERLMFYHDLISALAQWHRMINDEWGNFDYSMSAAESLNRIFEHDPYVRFFLARALLANNNQLEAYKQYWELLQKTGDRELIIAILSEQEFTRYKAALGKEAVLQISRQFPDNGRLHASLAKVSTYIDHDLKVNMLRQGVIADPWNISAVYGLSWDTKDFSEMKRLLNDMPDNATVNYFAGILAYRRMGDINKGIELLRKSLSITPGYITAVSELGSILEAADRYDDAITVYRDYLKVDSESLGAVEMNGRIGYIYLKRGQAREAVKIFSEIAESYKASAMKGAVFSYLATGDNVNAELWAKRLVERYPQPDKYSVLCKVYFRTEKVDQLMAALQQCVAVCPQYANGFINGWQERLNRKDLFQKGYGVLIYKVLRNAQAEKVGLVDGDIILSWGGIPVDSGHDLDLLRYPLGKREEMKILRKGSVLSFTVDSGMLGIQSEE